MSLKILTTHFTILQLHSIDFARNVWVRGSCPAQSLAFRTHDDYVLIMFVLAI